MQLKKKKKKKEMIFNYKIRKMIDYEHIFD